MFWDLGLIHLECLSVSLSRIHLGRFESFLTLPLLFCECLRFPLLLLLLSPGYFLGGFQEVFAALHFQVDLPGLLWGRERRVVLQRGSPDVMQAGCHAGDVKEDCMRKLQS